MRVFTVRKHACMHSIRQLVFIHGLFSWGWKGVRTRLAARRILLSHPLYPLSYLFFVVITAAALLLFFFLFLSLLNPIFFFFFLLLFLLSLGSKQSTPALL